MIDQIAALSLSKLLCLENKLYDHPIHEGKLDFSFIGKSLNL